jgi:hypothetical protein
MIPSAPLNEIPVYQASKWQKLPLLLSYHEMGELLALLPEWIVPLSGVIPLGEEIVPKAQFLEHYQEYLEQIDKGITRPKIDKRLTCAITSDLANLRKASVPNGVLIRVVKPVIQVQPYFLNYSQTADCFLDTTFSQDSFAWGLVFSVPQLFQNPETLEIEKVKDADFKALQTWARSRTIPTPFQVGENKIINFPARISKERKTPICMRQLK